jgi:hypothetical protein
MKVCPTVEGNMRIEAHFVRDYARLYPLTRYYSHDDLRATVRRIIRYPCPHPRAQERRAAPYAACLIRQRADDERIRGTQA